MGREELLPTAGHAQLLLHHAPKRDLSKCKHCTAPGWSQQLPEGCGSPLQSITHQNDRHLAGNRRLDHAAAGHTSAREGCAELWSTPPRHRARPRARGCSKSNRVKHHKSAALSTGEQSQRQDLRDPRVFPWLPPAKLGSGWLRPTARAAAGAGTPSPSVPPFLPKQRARAALKPPPP